MSPNPMTLPDLPQPLSAQLRFHPEWVMDPPWVFLEKFDEELVREIFRIKMQHLAKAAQLEAQIVETRGAMYNEIAEVLLKRG